MSPVEEIAKWVSEKPIWWKHAIRLSLRDNELYDATKNEIYQVALIEHGLQNNNDLFKSASGNINTTGFEAETGEVTLKTISHVNNVGALAKDQQLKFSRNGLTIIYGDNGAGKSSYSKILKHACLARGRPPEILGNVFEVSAEQASAKLSINIDDIEEQKEWNLNFKGDSNLKSIRIFDGEVADHFVNAEDKLGYKPAGLHLLEDLVLAINHIKKLISEETMSGNGLVLLPEFNETETGKFIQNISHETDISMLKSFIATELEKKSTTQLEAEIAELKSKSPKELRKELNNKKLQLQPFKEFLVLLTKNLSTEVFNEIKEKKLDSQKKSKLAKKLRNSWLEGLPLSNIGGSDWQIMWNAAEKYWQVVNQENKFPPSQGENCPLCLQTIDKDSAKRLSGFNEFVIDKTSLDAKEAEESCENIRRKILDYTLDIAPYKSAIALLDEIHPSFESDLKQLIENLEERKRIFCSTDSPKEIDSLSLTVIEQVKLALKQITNTLEEIAGEDNLDESIKKKEKLLMEIKDKKLFEKNLEQIESNISRYKDLEKYKKIESECNPSAVTRLNTKICKSEVVDPLVSSFQSELKKFGFNRFKVQTKTRGNSGAQLLKLEILESGEPLVAKVASEGEQRCISIACFLAEMQADKRKSAVIFDDPVNSLSHQWSARVAKRLVKESIKRQVIVLTHDIVFYKLLLEEVDLQEKATSNEVCLERNKRRAGIVRQSPPWDALTTGKRIKQLNVKFRNLQKLEDKGTESEFRRSSTELYGYLREAWERLVEEKLLNQVVTRFGRSVQTNRLKKLTDISEEDLQKIDTGMAKCSAYFRGHDSAPAIGDPYPTIEEVEEDISLLDEFNKELQSLRKRT